MRITTNQLTERVIENWVRAQFVVAWILAPIKEVGDKFHPIFQVGLQANPRRCESWMHNMVLVRSLITSMG